MCAQFMSLTWDNHHSLLISVLRELLESNIGANCTIVAEGHQVKAHQMLLSSFSPFFELLFKDIQDEHPIIILADTSYQDLEAIINYMYQGKLEIPQNQMTDVLETAKSLQLKGLSDTSKDNRSEKENINLQLQAHSNRHKRKRKPDVAVQNDIKQGQSYRGNTQHQTSTVTSVHQVVQSPVNLSSSDVTLQVPSVQKLSSFLVPSTSYSLEPKSLSLHGKTVVKIEPRDETFSTENMHEYEPERQENAEIHLYESSRNNYGQGIGDDANISVSTNVIRKSEENSQEYVPLQDYASLYISNLPDVESPPPMTSRQFSSTLNVSSAGGELATTVPSLQLGNATNDSRLSFVDPAELESDEFIVTDFNMIPEDVSEEETMMMNGASVSSMEQGEVLVEDEHIASRSEYSGSKSRIAASRRGLSLSCSTQTAGSSGTTAESPTFLTIKSGAETTCMDYGNSPKTNVTDLLKNYVCQECQKSFRKSSYLTQHMQVHRGIKPYKCTQCDYKSNQKSHLKRHISTHKGEKPYRCTLCDFATFEQYKLLGHHRLHTGEKPYKCTECDYASTWQSNLIIHRRIHTKKAIQVCAM